MLPQCTIIPPVLLERTHAFIDKHALLTPGQDLTVGVSGGTDSSVLLHVLTQMQPIYNMKMTVAHLDHGLRAESGSDAAFVIGLARDLGLPCRVERVDVAALARECSQSLEEAGRAARYAFFSKLGPTVAVAHNADDQAETVLMHFLRGSGPDGLRGMLPKTIWPAAAGAPHLTVIRPLLTEPRSEIEAYRAAQALPAVTDASNADRAFFRNRLRHELLPLLETYSPKIREILGRTAEVMAGDQMLLQSLVDETWSQVAKSGFGSISFSLPKWQALPRPMQRLLARRAVRELAPGLRDLDFTPLEQTLDWVETGESGHTADLFSGLALQITGESLRLIRWRDLRAAPGGPAPVSLAAPGRTEFGGWMLETDGPDVFVEAEIQTNRDPDQAYLAADSGPWLVRARRTGERFRPLGMSGHVKLADYMINRKVPSDQRARWPLICGGTDGVDVLWVCGVGLGEAARVTRTGRAIRVRLAARHAQ
jgi:tRNA(Ile)-lysidine synthase